MKLITAIVKPHKLQELRQTLSELGVRGITVTEVKGCGQQKGYVTESTLINSQSTFIPKVKIEIAARTEDVESIIAKIIEVANTQQIGDGKIFVTALERVIRIRTGEEGNAAL